MQPRDIASSKQSYLELTETQAGHDCALSGVENILNFKSFSTKAVRDLQLRVRPPIQQVVRHRLTDLLCFVV